MKGEVCCNYVKWKYIDMLIYIYKPQLEEQAYNKPPNKRKLQNCVEMFLGFTSQL